MIPNGQPKRVSLRTVRHATQAAINSANQHADLLNTQVLPGMRGLHQQQAETQRKLDEAIARLDAFLSRTWRGRLRYLFLGR